MTDGAADDVAGRAPEQWLATPGGRPRARALGVPFTGTPGRWNALTDVAGVEVGHRTRVEGDGVRTGVTGIHPRGRAHPEDPVAAGYHCLNGNGEMTGIAWVQEAGSVSGPLAVTSTSGVGAAHTGVVEWMHGEHPRLTEAWLLPVVAETWDGYLHDTTGWHLVPADTVSALSAARSGPLELGSVGGGTGMCCYGFKGGTGSASRRVQVAGGEVSLGVLLQANFGARPELTIAGVPVGRLLDAPDPLGQRGSVAGAGSVIVIVGTDAPLLPGQCAALARRVPLGLARTGTTGSHFSGDLFLAFSTANPGGFSPDLTALGATPRDYDQLRFLPWAAMNPLFAAVVAAVEEAVVEALVTAEELTGRDGNWVPALPHAPLQDLLGAAGVRPSGPRP